MTLENKENYFIPIKDIVLFLIIASIFFIITSTIFVLIDNYKHSYFLLLFVIYSIPIFLAVIINKTIKLLKFKNEIILKIIKLLFNIFAIIIVLISAFITFFVYSFSYEYIPHFVSSKNYFDSMYSLATHKPRILHFPISIPKNAQNYKFIYYELDGGCLSFNINEEYINEILEKNKNKVKKSMSLQDMLPPECFFKYLNISESELHLYTLYILYSLKDEFSNASYTSGIVVSKEKQHIVFFYKNHNGVFY